MQLAGVDQILVTDNPFNGNQSNQTWSTELRDRAVQEHCDYVLVVSLPDVRTARSPQPNVLSPNPQSTTNTYDPYLRRQDPDNYVRVSYQLSRDPATRPVEGFVTTHDSAPYQAVVAQALDLLANQVFSLRGWRNRALGATAPRRTEVHLRKHWLAKFFHPPSAF